MRIKWLDRRNVAFAILALVILAVAVDHFRVRLKVSPDPIDTCREVAVEADVAWMALGNRSVKIFVYGVGEKPKLWTSGGWRGAARTGLWVSDGMTMMLTDHNGKTLAKKTFESVVCPQ